MKLKLVTSAAIAAAALVLAATAGASAAQPVSKIVWYGDSDKDVAVTVAPSDSSRTNASGDKIPSNAHSADFPGVYFIWDAKQKDTGYLKVDAGLFDQFESFTLTTKESNTYTGFVIKPAAGQAKTDDGCYVFFIDKMVPKNINMVFIGGWVDKKVDYPEAEIGFIGYYVYDGVVMSTSIHWQTLYQPGECIDWDAVEAAYADWVARGGLVKLEDGWQTSGWDSRWIKPYPEGDVCYGDLGEGQVEAYYKKIYLDPGYEMPPAPYDIGFIGWYINDGKIMQTSFYWQTLAKPLDCIEWDAVYAAYEEWIAKGGLPYPGRGWLTSGSIGTFTVGPDDPSFCYEDVTENLIEAVYKAVYLDPGYDTPEVVVSFERYLAYVELWNDFYTDKVPNVTADHKTALYNHGGIAHYNALLASYGAASLPPYYAFDVSQKAVYDFWADQLEPGLTIVCDDLGIDLAKWVEDHQ